MKIQLFNKTSLSTLLKQLTIAECFAAMLLFCHFITIFAKTNNTEE